MAMDMIIAAFGFFCIGFYCILSKKNLFKLLIGISCMFKASDIVFVLSGSDAFAVLSIALEGCFAAILLVYITELDEHFGITDIRELMRLKG